MRIEENINLFKLDFESENYEKKLLQIFNQQRSQFRLSQFEHYEIA